MLGVRKNNFPHYFRPQRLDPTKTYTHGRLSPVVSAPAARPAALGGKRKRTWRVSSAIRSPNERAVLPS